VLTGRSFITGKSGSGKSNTASVVIENLLDNGFPVMIVDTDGEYYGLKEEYEILHAGADDECDIVVSPEHAEKLANLALEQNVPIILDVSGYLEEDTANELLLEVVKQLFAKEKRLKKPFLLVVEECHEYIPEGGGMDETGGKMLIKVGKRGRKHGLGIVGISQRPADVKRTSSPSATGSAGTGSPGTTTRRSWDASSARSTRAPSRIWATARPS